MKRRHLLAAGLGAPLATLAAPAIVRAEGKYPERIVRQHAEARIVMVSSVGYQENILAARQP